jgi:hypothetical protein
MSMTSSQDLDRAGDEQTRLQVGLASLEADTVYFHARLEILGEPTTTNQWAQHKVYKLLIQSIEDLILETKRQMIEDVDASGAQ